MSYATIRATINTAISAVATVGAVTNHKVQVTRIEDWDTFFGGANNNGWTISRIGRDEAQEEPGFRFQIVHQIEVEGYKQFTQANEGADETTFQDLIDAVADAIHGDVTIWVKQPADNSEAIQVETIDKINFGSVLCHHCIMKFSVEEFVVLSS